MGGNYGWSNRDKNYVHRVSFCESPTPVENYWTRSELLFCIWPVFRIFQYVICFENNFNIEFPSYAFYCLAGQNVWNACYQRCVFLPLIAYILENIFYTTKIYRNLLSEYFSVRRSASTNRKIENIHEKRWPSIPGLWIIPEFLNSFILMYFSHMKKSWSWLYNFLAFFEAYY